jgi:hypothetical protein
MRVPEPNTAALATRQPVAACDQARQARSIFVLDQIVHIDVNQQQTGIRGNPPGLIPRRWRGRGFRLALGHWRSRW